MTGLNLNTPLTRGQIEYCLRGAARQINEAGIVGSMVVAYSYAQGIHVPNSRMVQPSLDGFDASYSPIHRVGMRRHLEMGLLFIDRDIEAPSYSQGTSRRLTLRGPYAPAFGAYGGFLDVAKSKTSRVRFQPVRYGKFMLTVPSEAGTDEYGDPTEDESTIATLLVMSSMRRYASEMSDAPSSDLVLTS